MKVDEGWSIYEDYIVKLKLQDISYGVMKNIKYYMIRVIHNNKNYAIETGSKDKL